MSQLKLSSLIGNVANQYWQLINAMLFNLKTIGYVFVVFFSVALAAILLIIIFPSFYMFGVGLIFLAGLILALVGIIALPMGMLMLLSNRHLFIMADIRNKLFTIACVFCFLTSLFVSTSDFFIKNEVLSFGVIIYVFLSCTLYFWFAVYVCSKLFQLLFIAPLVMIAWVKISFEIFVGLHPAALLLMLLLSWMLFYRWWIIVSPRHSRIKSILFEMDRRKIQELSIEKLLYFASNRVKTSIGSLLLGYGDSVVSSINMLIATYLFALVFSFFTCKGFVDGNFTDSAFTAVMIAFGYSFLVSSMCLPARGMLTNVRKGWLVFAGKRVDLFLYLERLFFKGLGMLMVFNAVLIIVVLLVGKQSHYFMYCLGTLLGLSILVTLMFYVDIYFYKRGALVPGNINLMKSAVIFVCFAPLICYLIDKYQTFNVFETEDAIAIGLGLLVVLSLKTIRAQAINKWQAADF